MNNRLLERAKPETISVIVPTCRWLVTLEGYLRGVLEQDDTTGESDVVIVRERTERWGSHGHADADARAPKRLIIVGHPNLNDAASGLMDSQPRLSVVVPTRNRAHLLKDCLDSLAHQSYPHDRLELVVIDDGSVDDTKGVVEAFQKRETGVPCSYGWQPKLGVNASRNRGVRAATGAVIGFIDDDELAPPDVLRILAAALLENPAASAAGGAYRSKHEGKLQGLICPSCRATYKTSPAAEGANVWVKNLVGGCLLVRRDAFDKYGLFHESLSGPGDDAEWCARVFRSGGKLLLVEGAWVWHRVDLGQLRFTALMSNCISRTRNLARARQLMFWSNSWSADVCQATRFLAHGLRHRCSVGIAEGLAMLTLAFHWRLLLRRHGVGHSEPGSRHCAFDEIPNCFVGHNKSPGIRRFSD